jgi:predicted nucleotidyltransferase
MSSRPAGDGDLDGFDGDTIRSLLTELGRRLDQRGINARIFVVGGAAMALAYNRRRITRDIDAVFEPKTVIYEEALRMADDLGLPPGWLNRGVKGLMPDVAMPQLATETFSAPGVSVGVASAEYMFAMKASAARSEVDRDDLRTLMGELGIASVDEAFAVVERHYSPERLTPKSQFILEELVSEYLAERAGEDSPR